MAEAILQQGAMLNTASSVTDSSLTQHQRKVPQRRRTKKNMSLDVPAILAVLAAIATAMWLWAIMVGRKRKAVLRHKITAGFEGIFAIGTPTTQRSSEVAAEASVHSESYAKDSPATSKR